MIPDFGSVLVRRLLRASEFQLQVCSATPAKLLHVPRDAFDGLVRNNSRLGRQFLNNLLDHVCEQIDACHANRPSLKDTGIRK